MPDTPGFTPVNKTSTPGFTPVDATKVSPLPTGTMQAKPGGPMTGPSGEEIMPAAVRQRQQRSAIGKITPEQAAFATSPATGWEGIGQRFSEGTLGLGKQMVEESRKYAIAGPPVAIAKSIWGGQVGAAQKARETTGIESAGYRMASGVPVAGPMAASAGEIFGRGDWGGISEAIQAVLTGASLVPKGKTTAAYDYDLGHKAVDNSWQFGGHKMLSDSVERAKAEVADNVRQISARDTARNTQRQLPGTFGVAPAMDILKEKIGTAARPGTYDPAQIARWPNAAPVYQMLGEKMGQLQSFDQFKELRSAVGQAWARATKQGNSAEASILDDVYKKMADQMQQNLRGLGVDAQLKQYNKLHRQVVMAEHGPLGDALAQHPNPQVAPNANGADFWSAIFDPKMQRVVTRGLDDLRAYGLQDQFFKLKDEIKPVYEQVMKPGGRFDFKTRLALAGGLAAVGVSRPFLMAYAAMYAPQLLRIMRNYYAAKGMAGPSLSPGDMFTPPLLRGQMGMPEPGTGMGAAEMGGEESEMEMLRRNPPRGPATAPERAQGPQSVQEEREADKADYERRSKLAGKVEEARGSRAKSGVWKGKR